MRKSHTTRNILAFGFLTLAAIFVGTVHVLQNGNLRGQVSPPAITEGMLTRDADGTVTGLSYQNIGTFRIVDRGGEQERMVFTTVDGNSRIVWRFLEQSEQDPGQGKVRIFLNWWGQLMRVTDVYEVNGQTLTVSADLKKDGSPLSVSSTLEKDDKVLRNIQYSTLANATGVPLPCNETGCPLFRAAATKEVRAPILGFRVPSVDTNGSFTVTDRTIYGNIGTIESPSEQLTYQFDWTSKQLTETRKTSAGVRTTRWKDVTLKPNPDGGYSKIFGSYFGHPVDITETMDTPSGNTVTAAITSPNLAVNPSVVRLTDPDIREVYETQGAFRMFQAAMNKVRATKAGILQMDGGTYVIEPPEGMSPDEVLLDISGVEDLLVEGNDTKLLFRSLRTGMSVGSSATTTKRIHLRNFSIDWADPLAFKGKIQQTYDGTYLLLDGPEVKDLQQIPQITVIADYNFAAKKWGAINDGKRQSVDRSYVYEPETGPVPVASTEPGTLRFKFQEVLPAWVRDNTNVVATVRTPAAGLQVRVADDVTMENVSIYASPTIGFLGNNAGKGFRVVNSRVTRNPNDPNRLVSTLGDGIHLIAKSNVFIENNVVEFQGDDGLNVKGLYGTLDFVSDDKTMVKSTDNLSALTVGDRILFADPETLRPLGEYQLTQKLGAGRNGCPSNATKVCLKFSEALPSEVTVGTLMSNLSNASTPFIVRGNTFRNNRGRAMLIHTGPGIVENNKAAGQTYGGIFLITETNHYLLGPAPSDVTVRNNQITNVGFWTDQRLQSTLSAIGGGITPMAGIVVEARVELNPYTQITISPERVFRDILIEGNTVTGVPGLALFVSSSKNVTIRGNTFTGTNKWSFLPSSRVARAVTVMYTSDSTIRDNTIPGGIFVDPDNTDGIDVQ